MGGGGSKQSLEIERNRRLREFEEELVESHNQQSPHHHHHHQLTHQYFDQFLGPGSPGEGEDLFGNSSPSSSGRTGSSAETKNEPKEPQDQGVDREVEDAIAELEETFRTLTPVGNGDVLARGELGRSQSCGPLSLPEEGGGQGTLDRVGTPGIGPPGLAGPRNITRSRPLGHPNQPNNRKGGAALAAGGSDGEFNFKGALSAPPGVGVSILRDGVPFTPPWTPPKIAGFDVDRFREANGVGASSGVVRLPKNQPSAKEGDQGPHLNLRDNGEQSRRQDQKGVSAPPYTREEMELLRKLERDVS